jgi:phosphomannomutase
MNDLASIFKAYDIRGTVPEQLDSVGAHAIGVAFAHRVGGPTVLIARDMRPTGVDLADAFARGVREQGVDVVHLGLASTDLLYFASGSLNAPGVMFTASHNPAQYNGIKACLAGAKPIGLDNGLDEVRDMALAAGLCRSRRVVYRRVAHQAVAHRC